MCETFIEAKFIEEIRRSLTYDFYGYKSETVSTNTKFLNSFRLSVHHGYQISLCLLG